MIPRSVPIRFGGVTRKCSQRWDSTVHQHWEGYPRRRQGSQRSVQQWNLYGLNKGLACCSLESGTNGPYGRQRSQNRHHPRPLTNTGNFDKTIGFDDSVETGFCEVVSGEIDDGMWQNIVHVDERMQLGYNLVLPLLSFQLTRT